MLKRLILIGDRSEIVAKMTGALNNLTNAALAK